MKKLLALLLVMSMLFALTACGEDNENPESTGTSTSTTEGTNNSTDGTQNSTEGTTEGSTGGETTDSPTTPPTTNPPETEPPHTHSHSWGDWKVKTKALVDKAGTEQRVCSVCSATDTKASTKNAINNSFFDGGLVFIISNDYGSVNGSTLLHYARCTFDEFIDKAVAADTLFAALSKRFAYGITDDVKQQMKDIASRQGFYDAQSDTFTLYIDASDPGELKLLGYVHNGGNRYTTYYSFTPHDIDTTLDFAVELEYNRANGQPNRYLSIGRTDALPSNMIKSK